MHNLPVYHCCRATGSVVVDGVLDEPAWQEAEVAQLVLAESGAPPRQPTRARLLWDDSYLYAAFECQDDDIWGVTTARDQDIYNQEVVELFVDEDGDGHGYIEIEVSPLNAVLDLFMLWREDRQRGLWDWNSEGLRTAVVVEGDPTRRGTPDSSWTVELAVPMGDFMMVPHLPPRVRDRWRMNLYRIERDAEGDEYSAWSPPGRLNYHTPWRFGFLEFVA